MNYVKLIQNHKDFDIFSIFARFLLIKNKNDTTVNNI